MRGDGDCISSIDCLLIGAIWCYFFVLHCFCSWGIRGSCFGPGFVSDMEVRSSYFQTSAYFVRLSAKLQTSFCCELDSGDLTVRLFARLCYTLNFVDALR